MTTTRKTFPVPATKLVTWNGYYIYKNKKVKIYFYLLPNQEFDTEQFYEVYERIGTNGLNKMTVLGDISFIRNQHKIISRELITNSRELITNLFLKALTTQFGIFSLINIWLQPKNLITLIIRIASTISIGGAKVYISIR